MVCFYYFCFHSWLIWILSIDVLICVSNPFIVCDPSPGVKHLKQLTWQIGVRACVRVPTVGQSRWWIFLSDDIQGTNWTRPKDSWVFLL